mmetsp:Transcript_20837/g.30971  ORF Transcript_20837/g.30971 Transcript_20837/m.30971 type:complete len:87 (+) Transcript_20837:672-932(+)
MTEEGGTKAIPTAVGMEGHPNTLDHPTIARIKEEVIPMEATVRGKRDNITPTPPESVIQAVNPPRRIITSKISTFHPLRSNLIKDP